MPRAHRLLFVATLLLLAAPLAATPPPATPLRVLDGAVLPADKIVNGVLENLQPSVALIRDQVGALCSGTLIGCSHVLTATSCFCTDPSAGLVLTGLECAQRHDLLATHERSHLKQMSRVAGALQE